MKESGVTLKVQEILTKLQERRLKLCVACDENRSALRRNEGDWNGRIGEEEERKT